MENNLLVIPTVQIPTEDTTCKDNRVISIYCDCFERKQKDTLNVEDLSEMKDQIDILTPKRHIKSIADLVDVILVKIIKRADKFREPFQISFELLRILINSRLHESDNLFLLLSFLLVACGMAKAKNPQRISFIIYQIHNYFRLNQSFKLDFEFTQLSRFKSMILNNNALIAGYCSIFKMPVNTVKSIVSSALIWVFIPFGEIRNYYGYVFPKGIALNLHSVYNWPDGLIVNLIIHELSHFLLRRKNGVYDALFSTGESKLIRKTKVDDVEVSYVQESGCYACEHIVGPLFCMSKAMSRSCNYSDIMCYSNILMNNLQNSNILPLAPPLSENLLACQVKEEEYWCSDGLYYEEVEVDLNAEWCDGL